jgi:signal transduction histidine kinase
MTPPNCELADLRQRVAQLEALLARQQQAKEESLREKERFSIALQNSNISLAHVDRELRYTWIHNPHPDCFPEAVLGQRDDEISSSRGSADLSRFKSEVLETGVGARRELSFELKSGLRTFGIDAEPMRDASGEIIGITTAAVDITEHKTFEGLRADHNQSQLLSQRLVASQEAERRSIALELHDQIGQLLTGLKLTLERSTRAPTKSARNHLVNEAQNLISDLMARVRNLSIGLRPTMLDDLGLLPTMEWHVRNYSDLTKITVALDPIGVDQRFPPEVETAAYRICQEALTNIARHAEVNEARVSLRIDGDKLVIQVEDDGVGFSPDQISSFAACGLSGMRERVRLLGGKFTLNSIPGQGTCVTAELPVRVKS